MSHLIVNQALSQLPQSINYTEFAKAVQEVHDREMTVEFEKRERLMQRILELEEENKRLRSGASKHDALVQY